MAVQQLGANIDWLLWGARHNVEGRVAKFRRRIVRTVGEYQLLVLIGIDVCVCVCVLQAIAIRLMKVNLF